MTFRSSPYAQHSTLYPIIEHLQQFLQWQREETPETKLAKLEQVLQGYHLPVHDVVPLFAALLSLPLPAHHAPLSLNPQQQQRTQEALLAWLLEEAERQAVLMVWEDLHWADPSTLDWLGLCMDQAPTARLLILLTCRPDFRPPWAMRSHLTQLTLSRFTRPQGEAMVTRVAGGKALPKVCWCRATRSPRWMNCIDAHGAASRALREIDRRTLTHVGRMLNIKRGIWLKAPFDVPPLERGRTRSESKRPMAFYCHPLRRLLNFFLSPTR